MYEKRKIALKRLRTFNTDVSDLDIRYSQGWLDGVEFLLDLPQEYLRHEVLKLQQKGGAA